MLAKVISSDFDLGPHQGVAMSWFFGLVVIVFLGGVWAKLDQMQKDLFTIRQDLRGMQTREGTHGS